MSSIAALAALLLGRRIVALTGAGCSTESGIPDYRGPETRHQRRDPIQGPTFVKDEATRRRYWARAMIGWERFSRARPNAAHQALATLEAEGRLAGIVTQNVDRLHRAAGSRRVIELHGALADVRCLSCPARTSREAVQRRLVEANPELAARSFTSAPDGDAEVTEDAWRAFRVVDCEACGGALRPDVVFFGENVPRPVVDAAFALLDEADALLVVGTSLQVFSGYRFVVHASKRAVPIAMVNLGEARGQALAAVFVDGRAGEILPPLADALLRRA